MKGVPRLGIPEQFETDAGIGVATQGGEPNKRERTALPSGMATTATWNPELAYQGGAMIGAEARSSGFNVMLAGGVNLVREPRNGRNFEYGGEDPWLAGKMVGAQIKGIQSNSIVSTIKHYALNNQETGRFVLDAKIGEADARTSDLLAFQFAIEDSDPHSVMCAYNRINGDYACENDFLLNKVLKQDWGYKNYVMSDWGAVHSSAKAVNAGLDQQSAGEAFDRQNFLREPLRDALAKGEVSQARLDDMARRVLRGLFASGVVEKPVKIAPIDYAAHGKVTRADAEEGVVLLKNDKGLLPLLSTAKKIAVIGGHADVGVLSGGGSSQVYPIGGRAVQGEGPATWPGPMIYFPSSPLKALKARLPGADIQFADGKDEAAAAKLAAASDVVLVFATQWNGEAFDSPLTLENGQDALIDAVATANDKTVVVLETGGPVLMPWLSKVGGVVEAWYPGSEGGEAIARVLTGEVDASGRLPVTFPASVDQLPRPVLDGDPKTPDALFAVDYPIEGAAVGYKWFDKKGHQPLFAFGHGLSYTSFAYENLKAETKGDVLTVSFDVKNTGKRTGKAVPQVYVSPKAGGWSVPAPGRFQEGRAGARRDHQGHPDGRSAPARRWDVGELEWPAGAIDLQDDLEWSRQADRPGAEERPSRPPGPAAAARSRCRCSRQPGSPGTSPWSRRADLVGEARGRGRGERLVALLVEPLARPRSCSRRPVEAVGRLGIAVNANGATGPRWKRGR